MHPIYRKRVLRVILFFVGGILLILGYLLFWHLTGLGFVCPLHEFFGFSCPGCGITRALAALMRFDVLGALSYHPLVFLLIAYVLWYMISIAVQYVKGYRDPMDVRPYWVHFTFLGLFMTFGMLRAASEIFGWEILSFLSLPT